MRLLIVDDQLATLKGLAEGIDWEKENIKEVRTAQNAMEARLIFKEKVPDIMLCDIEMPVENGIDLCRWVKNQNYKTIVIFLTCHSEFDYAVEAIELGAIGYVLQPAPYEKIVSEVRKAMVVINEAKKQMEVLDKVRIYESKEHYFSGKLWKDYLLQKCNTKDLLETVDVPDPSREFYLLLLQLVQWKEEEKHWQEDLLNPSLLNIIEDVFGESDYYIDLVPVILDTYALVIQVKSGKCMEYEELINKLNYLISFFELYMPCGCACYPAQPAMIDLLPIRWNKLMNMKENNVAGKTGVFTTREAKTKMSPILLENILFWKEYLCMKCASKVEEEARDLLNQMSEAGILDATTLMKFYQEFMQMLYQAEQEENGKQVITLFDTKESMELYRNGMKSVNSMLDLIHHVVLEYSKSEEDQKERVEMIKRYINNHLDRNIKVDEIAGIVHLNADYMNRVFKKETGMSIKSYIIEQKMISARNLLQNTSSLVSHIALRLGYSNFSHFSATYKKQFGIIPSEEKRNNIEKSS